MSLWQDVQLYTSYTIANSGNTKLQNGQYNLYEKKLSYSVPTIHFDEWKQCLPTPPLLQLAIW